jgi:amidase
MEYSRREVLAGVAAGIPMAMAASAQTTGATGGSVYSTVRERVAALAARQVSAVELCAQAIARIEQYDGKLNAVVVRDFERARAAAAQADAALARGERRPLLGIPMTVKESFNVAGLPTTWGIAAAKGWQATADSVTVARLKAAGAIILGKTNVPFVLADFQSYNDIYGVTNNPWDTTRTPGGSSGGAAAALAAGFVPLELGSDIGGSLRVPAHFCGVLAHKPTYALVPSRGHVPPRAAALPVEVDLAVVGPMARSAGDLALALDVLAGPDGPQAKAYRLALPPPRHDRLADYRVLVLDTHPLLPSSHAVRGAIGRLADRLDKAGAKVARQSVLTPDLPLIARTYFSLLYAFFGADVPVETYRRLQQVAGASGDGADDLDAHQSRAFVLSHRDWIAADRARNGIAARFAALFGEFDVVVCPIMPTPAFAHDHGDRRSRRIDIDGTPHRYAYQAVWAGMASLTGLPATACPIERTDSGLPIGVQIVGPYLEDRTTIAFADQIERELGGFVPPPGFN